MKSRYLLLTSIALTLTAACASDPAPGPGTADAAPGSVDAAPGAADAAPGSPDAASATTASVAGVVKRSAQPSGDAKGNIYVALFDQDPIAHKDTAKSVGNALITAADLSGAGATVAYSIDGVPPRAEAYYAIAFLDDNGNVDQSNPSAAGPDKGDLVSLNGVSAPKIVLAEPGAHTMDLDLSLVMPF